MSRQQFTKGQAVDCYLNLGYKLNYWCQGKVTRNGDGFYVEVLARNPISDIYQRRWVRNDRRLIRPKGETP